jgi:hypothetical protein
MAPSRGEEMAEGLQASSSSSPWIPEVEADWKQQVAVAGKLWWAGFRDACCLHRALASCKRSRRVYVKTGQCFLLNGCIFLGRCKNITLQVSSHCLCFYTIQDCACSMKGFIHLGTFSLSVSDVLVHNLSKQ